MLPTSYHWPRLMRLKHAAALFNSFSATLSVDWVASLKDDSELHMNINHHAEKSLDMD